MDTGLVLSDYNKVAFKKPDLFILSQISIQEKDLNRNNRGWISKVNCKFTKQIRSADFNW